MVFLFKSRGILKMMRIPIFGDLHGNIEGMLGTLQYLQKKNKEIYWYVLQTGDFSFFPDVSQLDDATKKRWGNPSERGVTDFLNSSHIYTSYFLTPRDYQRLECKIIFIRGNHEDQNYLKRQELVVPEGLISLDPFGVLFYLADGRAFSIQTGNNSDLIVAGYGGISKESRPRSYKRNQKISFCERGLDRLLSLNEIDVLMTHQGPDSIAGGAEMISTLCSFFKTKSHIHGHSHKSSGPTLIDRTKSYSLGRIPESKKPIRRTGFYGLLECGEELKFTLTTQ